MELTKLVQELQSIDKSITEAEVKQWITENGRSLSTITTNDLLEIATAIKSGAGKLATSPKGGKPTKGKRQERTQAPKANALTKPSQEMDAYESSVLAGIDQYVDVRGNAIASAIQEAPNKLVSKVQTILEEGDCDPDHFRNAGNELVSALFGVSQSAPSAE